MPSPIDAIIDGTCKVTKDWAKQIRDEEKDQKAFFRRTYRLVKSLRTSIREAAFRVMRKAYLKASDGGKLPVKPRQIMYAARPEILVATDVDSLGSSYFSQQLLIDYMEQHNCSDWDIIWDARGNFIEPHTGVRVPLGTLEVRQYLGDRPSFASLGPKIIDASDFPTIGPKNRYRNILFIEKEGFHPILEADGLPNRLDIGLLSTKGMSNTASRKLIDGLKPYIDNLFVLHDFDIYGFSIAGTLGNSSRRYSFENKVEIVDIGLRLVDVEAMSLESEPTAIPVNEWPARAHTLRRHGATQEEVAFLTDRRVELNAMTSRQFVDFVEQKLLANGVSKVIPDDDVLEQHARRVLEAELTNRELKKIGKKIAEKVKATSLPSDWSLQVEKYLIRYPQVSWDNAVAAIIMKNRNGAS